MDKTLKLMEEIYNSSLNDIKNYIISQKNPMKNIYNNKKNFELIQKSFQEIYIKFED